MLIQEDIIQKNQPQSPNQAFVAIADIGREGEQVMFGTLGTLVD
mgnify:CR=1 FL=1